MPGSPPDIPKRPVRTYGRPKPATEVSTSKPSTNVYNSIANDDSLLNMGSDTPGEAPPTSEPSNSPLVEAENDGRNRVDGGNKDASSGHPWKWKVDMKHMDESEDEDGGSLQKTESSGDKWSKPTDPEPLFSGQRDGHILHTLASPSHETELSLSQDVFSDSPSKLAPSSFGHSHRTSASPTPSPTFLRQRVSKHIKCVESDGEVERETDRSSYSSSPVKHPINTPQTRSSTTPPTSDAEDEMPSRKAKRHSKGKSVAIMNPLVLQPAVDVDVRKAKGKRSQSNKVKAPTKKERRDTVIERQRMNAEKPVSIPRVQRSSKLTFNNLLSKIAGNTPAPLKGEDSMDPISEFSEYSSPTRNRSAVVPADTKLTEAETPRASMPELPSGADSDEEQLPDIDQLLKSLQEKKLLALQQQGQLRSGALASDDDDDLEIVNVPSTSMQVAMQKEADARKSGRPGITASTRILQKHAGISSSRRTGEVASASQARNSRELNEVLLKRVNAENTRRTQQKTEEWISRGGKPLGPEIQASERHGLDWYAQKALEDLKKTNAENGNRHQGGTDDQEDEEWTSLRGSASPALVEQDSNNGYEENEGDDEEGFEDDQDITMVNEDTQDEDIPTQVDLPHRRAVRPIVDSDTEDEDNNENLHAQRRSLGKVLVQDSMILDQDSDKVSPLPQFAHRQSDSSYDGGATEDECDKENNDRLMYDRSEDKENTSVVQHELLNHGPSPGRRSSVHNLEEGLSSRLSVSLDGYATDEDKENPRSPLKTLSVSEIEPFTPAAVSFAIRLERATSTASIADKAPDPLLSPRVSRESQMSGFSQFSDDGEGFRPKKLEAGFSGFFDSQIPSSSSSPLLGSLTEPGQSNNFFDKLRRNNPLALTQEVGLQPALEVDESLKRQADEVFEREQELIIETVNASTSKKPELYINDQGFLTQTRPDGNVEVYRPPPTPSQFFSQNGQFATQAISSQGLTRRPFRELSMSEAESTEDTPVRRNRLHRLKKRDESGSSSSAQLSNIFGERSISPPLPSPRPRRHRPVESQIRKIGQRLEKSEFIEGEAQESDEDEMFGFRKVEEDEEDGEHLDRNLETLVDDKELDQTQIAKDKVMEKFQEQRQADDAHVEDVAHKLAQGHFRNGKRSRGQASIDNSDDDDEEDETGRRVRWKMKKEPELRGDIKSLAGQDATRAFAEQYQAAINSDGDPELAFLQGDDAKDIIMTGPNYGQDDDDDANEDDEDDENTVNTSDIMRQLREAAKRGKDDCPAIDPNDLSFVDVDNDDEDEDLPRVRHVTNANIHTRGTRKGAVGTLVFDPTENHRSELMVDEQGRQRAQEYVKNENRLRRMGTGRSVVGGISVVGNRHPNSRVGSHARNNPTTSKKPPPIKAAPSILKGLTRKEHFQ
ncbi:hypothetical protein GG344DRAFT_75624 [Lentinula edodes]|nr:hypothetical protein GG344DRAFT_75624 [Lentinula edodes]